MTREEQIRSQWEKIRESAQKSRAHFVQCEDPFQEWALDGDGYRIPKMTFYRRSMVYDTNPPFIIEWFECEGFQTEAWGR